MRFITFILFLSSLNSFSQGLKGNGIYYKDNAGYVVNGTDTFKIGSGMVTMNNSSLLPTTTKNIGECIMITNTLPTPFTLVATPVKIVGTTISTMLSNFTMPSSCRLKYTGTSTITAKVSASMSVKDATNQSEVFRFFVYKNGVSTVNFTSTITMTVSGSYYQAEVQATISLNTNDYIEIYVANNTSASFPITVEQMQLNVSGL